MRDARGQLALIDEDVDGGFNVLDTRNGEPIAWRFYVGDAATVAARLNASYPAVAPARDTLVFEVAMERIAGKAAPSLAQLDWRGMIPDGIDDRPALWKPRVV